MDPKVDVVYSDLIYVARNSQRVVRRWYAGTFHSKRIKNGWMPPHPTLFVSRNIYQQIGKFDTDYKISGDYLSILKIFQIQNLNFAYIPEFLIKMRLGGLAVNHLTFCVN